MKLLDMVARFWQQIHLGRIGHVISNRPRKSIDLQAPLATRESGTRTKSIAREYAVQRRISINSLSIVPLVAATFALCLIAPAQAQPGDPIKIGVIAEVQSIAGAATPGGAQIAAEEINAKGGVLGRKIEIVSYDNKSSSADSVRPSSEPLVKIRSRP
jgi:ABC-type branched-subunit amino acid transport system substrate-binding protein